MFIVSRQIQERGRDSGDERKKDGEGFCLSHTHSHTHTLSSCETGRTCCSAKTKKQQQFGVSESATPCEISGDAEEVLAPGMPRSRPLTVCSSAVNLESGGIIYYTPI